jgi:hypothetical protein
MLDGAVVKISSSSFWRPPIGGTLEDVFWRVIHISSKGILSSYIACLIWKLVSPVVIDRRRM